MMSAVCDTLALSASGVPENKQSLGHIVQGFRHFGSIGGLTMAGIKVDEGDTVADIDEALAYLTETLKRVLNRSDFLEIVDALLDERLEKSCA